MAVATVATVAAGGPTFGGVLVNAPLCRGSGGDVAAAVATATAMAGMPAMGTVAIPERTKVIVLMSAGRTSGGDMGDGDGN